MESVDLDTKRGCAMKLVNLQTHLIAVRNDSQWDLADFCLDRCSEPISKIATAMSITSQSVAGNVPATISRHGVDPAEAADNMMAALPEDFFLPMDPLDYPFDALWDIPF